MTNPASNISLNGLELSVNLGWPEEERQQKQLVLVDVNIRLLKPPQACHTDQLEDTFCYDALVTAIKSYTTQESFRLVEHLGYKIYKLIKDITQNNALVTIRLHKKPAIANLTGGVAFSYGDEELTW